MELYDMTMPLKMLYPEQASHERYLEESKEKNGSKTPLQAVMLLMSICHFGIGAHVLVIKY